MPKAVVEAKRPSKQPSLNPLKKRDYTKTKGTPSNGGRKAPLTTKRSHLGDKEATEDNSETDVEDHEHVDIEDAEMGSKNRVSTRENHQNQRLLQAQRRAAKPNSSLLLDAKRVWSIAHKIDLPKVERQASIKELMGIVRGKVKEVVFKHDASRIIQTLVRYGGQGERNEIAQELKGCYVELAQNKYAKFLVTKLIRYCTVHRPSILSEFHGHVLRLLLHKEASQVVADAFELYANSSDRNLLVRDFYGKEVALFDIGKVARDGHGKSGGLAVALGGTGVDSRKRILAALKDNLITIFNNPDKGAVGHSIVHYALWEYLSESNKLETEAERDKARRDMFESSQELLAELVHTRDGSRCVREYLAYGTAKDRKQIVKILKPHLQSICQNDCAQLVLFTALDVIDDTKLVLKSLVSELVSLAPSLTFPPISSSDNGSKATSGRRSLLYLVTPRNPRHFTPAIVASLTETDPVREKASKKDSIVRANELRLGASQGLLSFIVEDLNHGDRLLRDPAATLLLAELMLYCEGDKSAASEAIIRALADLPYDPDNLASGKTDASSHLIDLSHSSRLYKTLLQGGHYSQQTQSIVRPNSFSSLLFARMFCNMVGKSKIMAFSKGSGAFVITALIETCIRDGASDERRLLIDWFDDTSKKEIEARKNHGKGKEALLTKLHELELV